MRKSLPHRFLVDFQSHSYVTIARAKILHLLDLGSELLVHCYRWIERNLDLDGDEGGGTNWSPLGP